jgi:biopolymer transport protein ExbB
MINRMNKKAVAALSAFLCMSTQLMAADEAAEETVKQTGNSFGQIVWGGTGIDKFIWVLIFLSCIATVACIVDAIMLLKREKIIPTDLVEGVRESLDEGDLEGAIATCEETPSPLANILLTAFANISEGYEVVQDAVSSAADMESEKLLQRINYLNVFGQLGPMLGLLGTVSGMVSAFEMMATKTGGEKASSLALAISGALFTTVFGLLISIPALLGFTVARNSCIRIIIESQSTVLEIIKVLKDAEVGDDDDEDEDED